MRRIIITSAIALALGGCGQGGPQAADGNAAAPAAPAAPAPPGAPAVPGSPASEVRRDAAFSGLPEGIPPYPRTDGRGAIQMGDPSEEHGVRIMAFQTPDPPATVIAFYAEAGASAGYREVRRAEAGSSIALGLARADGDALNVTATGSGGTTRVQIMTGNEGRGR
jgi:hypothetical protein